jgi:hypothetical protein
MKNTRQKVISCSEKHKQQQWFSLANYSDSEKRKDFFS